MSTTDVSVKHVLLNAPSGMHLGSYTGMEVEILEEDDRHVTIRIPGYPFGKVTLPKRFVGPPPQRAA